MNKKFISEKEKFIFNGSTYKRSLNITFFCTTHLIMILIIKQTNPYVTIEKSTIQTDSKQYSNLTKSWTQTCLFLKFAQ